MKARARQLILPLTLLAVLLGAGAASAGPWVPRPVCRFLDLYAQASAADAGFLESLLYLVVLTSGAGAGAAD